MRVHRFSLRDTITMAGILQLQLQLTTWEEYPPGMRRVGYSPGIRRATDNKFFDFQFPIPPLAI